MSQDDNIQFRFEHGDLAVEISGPRRFVERLSREIMHDVGEFVGVGTESSVKAHTSGEDETDPSNNAAPEGARQRSAQQGDDAAEPRDGEPRSKTLGNMVKPAASRGTSGPTTDASDAKHDATVVWLVRCGELMQRIFMARSSDIDQTIIGDVLREEALHSLYVPSSLFDEAFPNMASSTSTVWGQLTDAGRIEMDASDDSKT